jgi:CRP-like cAMP-binding protein
MPDPRPASAPAFDSARALSGFALFAGLEPASLAALAGVTRRQSWGAGALIFQRGDEGSHMLAVLSGRIRLSLSTAQGKELVLRHLGPGDVLGELALVDGQPRSADAAALEPVSALVIQRAPFLGIAGRDPGLGLALARYLCAMLRQTNFQMESIALYDLQMRVVRFLLFSLRQIHGAALPDRAVLTLALNQSELSAVLGASRPKINQVLQGLAAAGAIRREGDQVVCLCARLLELSETSDPAGPQG